MLTLFTNVTFPVVKDITGTLAAKIPYTSPEFGRNKITLGISVIIWKRQNLGR